MKMLRTICLVSAIVALPGLAGAQTGAPNNVKNMNCPMTDMSAMHKQMAAMMTDMDGMMNIASDPAQKAHMRKMHDQMAAMMTGMQKMGGGMGGMMQGGKKMESVPSPASPATPDDRTTHHPGQ